MRRHGDRLGIARQVVDIHFDRIFSRRQGLVKIHALVYRAHQHRLRADSRIVKRELSLRIALGIRYWLHAALQLNQDHFDRRGGLAGCCVRDFALYRRRMR